MFETKLIQLFVRLSAEERRRLRKWMVSDFVNKNEDIIRFFEFIDSRTSVNENTVKKEKAHEYLYKNTPYNDLRIRHLIWMTTDILENFIAYNSLSNQQALKESLLAQYYAEKELFKYANDSIEDGLAVTEKMPLRNGVYYISRYQFFSEFYHVNSRNNRSQDFKLQEVIDSITLFSAFEILKYACIVQSFQKISAHKIENPLLEPVLSFIKQPAYLEITPLRIYYHIYRVITEENDEAFDSFINDIKKQNHSFTKQDLKDLYLLAINFCIKKSNQNILRYTEMAFELYLYAVKEGHLLEHNEISRFSFTNVVTLGLKLKDLARTEQFIKDYSSLIMEEYRQNTIDFNTAKTLYAKEQYKKALKILLTNEFKDTIWNLNAKYLTIKIFFETEDMESFQTYLKAFKIYIKRKSNVGYHKTYFTQVMQALSRLQEIYNRPYKFKNFVFPEDTPDIDWFNKALKKAQRKASA